MSIRAPSVMAAIAARLLIEHGVVGQVKRDGSRVVAADTLPGPGELSHWRILMLSGMNSRSLAQLRGVPAQLIAPRYRLVYK